MGLSSHSRNEIIDIAKGIGILLVVYAHAYLPLSSVIEYFHMPLFFFLSGYTFKESDSIKDTFTKRIKRLYFPFVLINAVFLILNPLLFSIGLDEKSFRAEDYLNQFLKIITFQNAQPIISQCWYLLGLFTVSIVFKVFFNICGKKITIILYAILAVVGLFMVSYDIRLKYGNCDLLNVVLISSAFYLTGFLSRDYINNLQRNAPYIERGTVLAVLLSGIIMLVSRLVFLHEGGFKGNNFNDIIWVYPAAFSGIVLTLIISSLLSKIGNLKELWIFLGKNTMIIFLLHTIVFKAVSALMVKFFSYDAPLYGWGGINGGIVWNCLHFFAGVTIPMLVYYIVYQIILKRK